MKFVIIYQNSLNQASHLKIMESLLYMHFKESFKFSICYYNLLCFVLEHFGVIQQTPRCVSPHFGLLWLRTPMVSSNVIAFIFREARMASLSAKVGSSLEGTCQCFRTIYIYVQFVFSFTFAESITHISHRFTLTARRSALLKGDP